MLLLVIRHVIEIQEIGIEKLGPESGWSSSNSSWQCYYTLGTTSKLSILFQVLGLWLHLFFLGLDLTITEINIKKVQKQDLKM